MTEGVAGDLRSLIAATVREVVAELVTESVRDSLAAGVGEGSGQPLPQARSTAFLAVPTREPSSPGHAPVVTAGPTPTSGRRRVETVRIRDDRDLEEFARHLLELFENPKNRQDLRAGRYRFTLAPATRPGPESAVPTRRIERGAVTERHVKSAAEAGERIMLGPRAVITPLARERARSLGVEIKKER